MWLAIGGFCGVCFQYMSCIPVFLLFPLRESNSSPMISSLNSFFLPHVVSSILLQSEPPIISRLKTFSASLLNKVNCPHVKVATFHDMLRIVLSCVQPCHLSHSLLPEVASYCVFLAFLQDVPPPSMPSQISTCQNPVLISTLHAPASLRSPSPSHALRGDTENI